LHGNGNAIIVAVVSKTLVYSISTFFDEKYYKMNNFLIILVSWATK